MKKNIPFLAILLMLAGTTFVGCNKKGCTDPMAINHDEDATKNDGSCEYEDPQLEMHIHPMFGSSSFAYGTEYSLADGRKLKISTARFYLSNFKLMGANGDVALTDVYRQFKPGQMMYDLGKVPAGTYTGIGFDIGVSDPANTSDPSTWPDDHALSSSSATHDHWSWNSGYVYIKIEGMVDGSAGMNEPVDDDFIYHVGTENFLRSVSISHDLTLAEGGEGTLHLMVDVEKFFDGLDMTADFDTHTMNDMPLANKVANNVAASIMAQ